MLITYTIGVDGYVNNYSTVGEFNGGKTAEVVGFDKDNFDCYKEVDGKLVLDETKKEEKLNTIRENQKLIMG